MIPQDKKDAPALQARSQSSHEEWLSVFEKVVGDDGRDLGGEDDPVAWGEARDEVDGDYWVKGNDVWKLKQKRFLTSHMTKMAHILTFRALYEGIIVP
ncbi:MAG: hypothetical protein M3Y13_09280 [Armatimonadota bacterium]|nr:hypothetical protein [Armatimonadota bacterium]